MKKEDIPFLNQLINSLEEAEINLEKVYFKKDYEAFNELKKTILHLQKKISEITK